MAEIFISYSRRNKEFVLKFLDALKENNYSAEDIWVDWEDIPSSSKWEQEIQKGILDSNSIIFILSPEWVASRECAKELDYAFESNKRLFPIVCKDVDPKKVPEELSSLNWIFFRESDDMNAAMAKLVDALNTDLEYAAQHTSILGRAKKWEASNRDTSLLLRGAELTSAETWLSQESETKQPRPTKLQREYIFASRQDDALRQRRRLISVVSALVISLILAISAAVAGLEALRQSQRAMASQLAALSTNLVNTQPDLSLLLSLEANFIGDELGETDPAWLGSLVTSMNSSPRLGIYLRGHQFDVRGVSFSPDGKWLATAGGSPNGDFGEAILWDVSSSTANKSYQIMTDTTGRLLAVAFSPDSQLVAAAGVDETIYIWNTANCCTDVISFPTDFTVRALTFAELSGKVYIVAAGDQKVEFWDVNTGKMDPSRTLTIPANYDRTRILSVAASSRGELATGDEEGYITLWDLKNKEIKFHVCGFGDPDPNGTPACETTTDFTDIRGLAFNKSGSLLVSASSDHRAWLWSTSTGEFLAKSADVSEGGHINTVSSVAFNPVNNQVATVSWDNTVRLWDLSLEDNRWKFNRTDTLAGHANSVWAVAFSPDGKRLATGSSDTTVIYWRLDQINQIGTPLARMEGEVWALSRSWDGKQLAAGDEAGNIRIWNYDGNSLSDPIELVHEGGVLTLAFSRDNQQLASAGYDNNILIWDAHVGELIKTIEGAHTDQIWQLMYSPDDTLLASISFDKTAKLWDTARYDLFTEPLEHDIEMFALTFNEDGTRLLTAGYGDNIFVWGLDDPAAPERLDPLTGHSATVNSLAFNWRYPPLLASTSDDKSLLAWDVEFMEHSPKVVGLNESMEAVTFNPRGDWLASATDNSTVLLWQLEAERCSEVWDPSTCQPTRLGTPLVGHVAPVENVVFLSNDALISSSEDGQLVFWNLSKHDWYQKGCEIVNRPFADDEYNQYIEGRINTVLLDVVNWITDTFAPGDFPDPPPCIQDSLP